MSRFLARIDRLPPGLETARPARISWDDAVGRVQVRLREIERWPDLVPLLGSVEPDVRFFHSQAEESVLLLESGPTLYVKEFFFFTLTGRIRQEFLAWALFLDLVLAGKAGDAAIDLHSGLAPLLDRRRASLGAEELASLGYADDPPWAPHLLSLAFLLELKGGDPTALGHLERKIVKDHVGSARTKEMLGLEESAFRYLETPVVAGGHAPEREIALLLQSEFEERKRGFHDWVETSVVHRKVLFWTWWNISPFVSADVAILLPAILDRMRIRKVFLDLSPASQGFLDAWLSGRDSGEQALEKEIRRIYPPFLEDVQKETLPYVVLLEKLRDFRIPVECIGLDGLELMECEPKTMKDGGLRFSPHPTWRRRTAESFLDLDGGVEGLTIFFHFLKPMHPVPVTFQDERIEKIIHADKFTGFGPKRPQSALSWFSRFASPSQRSFVLPGLRDSRLKEERIVHFPYRDEEPEIRLDDSGFNRFGLFDTMIYSSHAGGGGGSDFEEVPDPGERSRLPVGAP